MDAVWPYLAALAPFLFGALAFYVIMKNIMTSDRNERQAQREWDRQHQSSSGSGDPDVGTHSD